MDLNVIVFAGGVGGAKLVDGLTAILGPESLTIVVNTADDFTHLGLHISPDLDTITYTLAGIADPQRGWGRVDESWAFLEALETYGGPTWFQLGDRDLALHHARTLRLNQGDSLSTCTRALRERLGVKHEILPMCDDPVRTMVITAEGEIPFQTYFVARHCEPKVKGFHFEGVESARPAPGVLEGIQAADLVIFCPSNPWVSLDPILAIPGIRSAVRVKRVFMVSPIIGGAAVKGPAAKMYTELGIKPSALAVAKHYADVLRGMIIDHRDRELASEIEALGLRVSVEQTLMRTPQDRKDLAAALLQFAKSVPVKE